MQNNFSQRPNLIYRTTEQWRPPLFTRGTSRRQKTIAAVRRFFDLQAGSIWDDLSAVMPMIRGSVLDVGCGAQPYRSLLSLDVNYIGIDTIDARSKFGYEMPDTIYFSGDIWPVEAESIDFILCTETLEHIPEPTKFLNEMRRCLRKGGRILLTVPFAARWHFIPYDYWRFTPSGLNHLLKEAGFVNTEVYARGNQVTVACYKLMALIISLLLSQSANIFSKWISQLSGILAAPLLLITAIIGNISLTMAGGDDCLGYTVLAERKD